MSTLFDINEATVKKAMDLVATARKLADDYGPEVIQTIEAAAAEPLDDATATRLFTRILLVLRSHNGTVDSETSQRIAAEVAAEVAKIVSDRRRQGIELVPRNGLEPHDVVPVPLFNGVAIPMREGYVDVTTLDLWAENHRIDLYVREFQEREHRAPNSEELLALVQGKLKNLSAAKGDPFEILPLARSIASKGVERPPILTWEGEPKDGNRRIAAARYVLESPDFNLNEKERARWVKVWQAPQSTTDDQFEAIVVALNFEGDYKEPWPEYVKARLVYRRYHELREAVPGQVTDAKALELRKKVAQSYAITPSEVSRYIRMVQWAEDFEAFHREERAAEPAEVRYKANEIFQWFYEIEAGRGHDKLTEVIDRDENLKPVIYDLMYHVLKSGAQLRSLHKVVKDETALGLLQRAHGQWETKQDEQGREEALRLVDAAIAEAAKNAPTKKIGFEMFLQTAVDRFGSASPDQWHSISSQVLLDLARVLPATQGAIQGELATRGVQLAASPEA